MEAATTLPFSQVRVAGGRLYVDGLVVDDDTAVRLATARTEAGEDLAGLVADAIAIGARVLDRETAGAHAEYVKAEFERAARELDGAFSERARVVTEGLDRRLEEVFGAENGQLTRALARHFDDESAVAVQNRVKLLLGEVGVQMREDLRKQFSSDSDTNPLATFQRMTVDAMRDGAQRQAEQLKTMNEALAVLREDVVRLQSEKAKLQELATEADRGTAKGRSYEEEVASALDRLATPQGDDSDAVGDRSDAAGKRGDVVVAIGACQGPALGRIVFEAKNSRLSRPDALRQLDEALTQRNAQYAVLVVPSDEKVPARMHALREYNGDKLVVTFDPEEGPLTLQVAYGLARARVLMARGDGDGVDGAAVSDVVERALLSLEEVRRVRQQLTAAQTAIGKADEIVGAMSDQVRTQLAEVARLVRAAEIAAA